jgi:hypothetical protein
MRSNFDLANTVLMSICTIASTVIAYLVLQDHSQYKELLEIAKKTDRQLQISEQQQQTQLERDDVFAAISALDRATNFWVVVVLGEASMAERFVYDCRPTTMGRLTAIAPGDFFIGDKKYGWLVYFKCDRVENTVTLIKAGDFLSFF